MDRTVRMTRRTLLCAVFACPLAFWSLPAALLCQLMFTLTCLLPHHRQKKLWAKPSGGFRAGLGRALYALCLAAALTALLHFAAKRCSLSTAIMPVFRILSMLSGILLQASLIYRTKRTGRLHLAACLPAMLLFIACTR